VPREATVSEEPSQLYRDQAWMKMRDNLDASHVFMALVTEHWLDDPICWAQLGYAVMKDKPIVLLVREGTPIPENLRRCARGIEVFLFDEDAFLKAKKLLEEQR
jgi:hypothetical protein